MEPRQIPDNKLDVEGIGTQPSYCPPDRCRAERPLDDMAEKLLTEGDTDGYSCTPEYKGGSFIPSKPMIAATKDRMPVFAVKKLKRKHRKRVSAS